VIPLLSPSRYEKNRKGRVRKKGVRGGEKKEKQKSPNFLPHCSQKERGGGGDSIRTRRKESGLNPSSPYRMEKKGGKLRQERGGPYFPLRELLGGGEPEIGRNLHMSGGYILAHQ